ncbi:MAG: hypothetical protein AABW51_04060 [Nanoarchaeota archaeon]
MAKPSLPITRMDPDTFNSRFKTKHLDGEVLNDEDLKAVGSAFGLSGTPEVDSRIGYIPCDEAHAHGYKCINYNRPESGVVDRLLREIRNYQSKLKKTP